MSLCFFLVSYVFVVSVIQVTYKFFNLMGRSFTFFCCVSYSSCIQK